jgi:hypothetical protein
MCRTMSAARCPAVQVFLDRLHVQAKRPGLIPVGRQSRVETALHALRRLDDDAQGIVDLVRHAGREPAERQHLLRLHHGLLHQLHLGDVPDDVQRTAFPADLYALA